MDDGLPEQNVYPRDIDGELSAPNSLLLIAKDKIERDLAAEARHSGNGDLAEWLDAVISRQGPDGTRPTEANVTKIIESMKLGHGHNRMKERDIYNQFGCRQMRFTVSRYTLLITLLMALLTAVLVRCKDPVPLSPIAGFFERKLIAI